MRFLIPVAALVASAGCVLLSTACARVRVEPVEIKPIHITIDINLKIDDALKDFFETPPKPVESAGGATPAASGTTPATAPAPAN